MTTLDARPQSAPLAGYAGDTLTVRVTVSDYAVVAGMQWDAQVRSDPESAGVDATFSIVPPTAPGQAAVLTLASADTARLANSGDVVRVREGTTSMTVKRYTGTWDCQISAAGGDPVRTVVRGTVIIDKDVTRLGA